MIRVYVASKIDHAQMWLDLFATSRWSKIAELASSWPEQIIAGYEEEIDQNLLSLCWENNLKEVLFSDFCLVYAPPGDVLRGALIEAGMAYVSQKCRVMVVGESPSYETWQLLPGTIHVRDLDQAFHFLSIITDIKGRNRAHLDSFIS